MSQGGADRKHRRKEEAQTSTVVAFQAYSRTLETVTAFKYLGRVLTPYDGDWMEVVVNLWKAWRKWSRLSSILWR